MAILEFSPRKTEQELKVSLCLAFTWSLHSSLHIPGLFCFRHINLHQTIALERPAQSRTTPISTLPTAWPKRKIKCWCFKNNLARKETINQITINTTWLISMFAVSFHQGIAHNQIRTLMLPLNGFGVSHSLLNFLSTTAKSFFWTM